MKSRIKKILLLVGVALLILQIPWFIVARALANKSMHKTTATVIRMVHSDAGCTGSFRANATCDHSNRIYPVYEYYDQHGKKYIQDDRFFGTYKRNNPLGKLFLKQVGDTVPAYYTKDKPQEVLFMASPEAYTAWLLPLYVAVTCFAVACIVPYIHHLGKILDFKKFSKVR